MKPDTDKYPSGLAKYYEERFSSWNKKNEQIKLLEIGVFHGGGFYLYRDLLPNALLFGIDVVQPDGAPPDATIRMVNQLDAEGLEAFAKEFGPFDVIIDDGCHTYSAIKNCHTVLWKHLNPGGFYFVEDWSICYFESYRNKPQFTANLHFAHEMLDFVDNISTAIKNSEIIHNRPPAFSIIALQKNE